MPEVEMGSQNKKGNGSRRSNVPMEDYERACVKIYRSRFQKKRDLMIGQGKYFYDGEWLSRDNIFSKEKEKRRAALIHFIDLMLVDGILVLSTLGVYELIVRFLIPR
jgi:hypothetical protein